MKCVVLDDYQGVATEYADWQSIPGLQVHTVQEHVLDGELLQRLEGAEVIVAMRERTPFTASLLEDLPCLRLLVTTAMVNASIDLDAARRLGIAVCGTPSLPTPHVELTWALIHALTRNLVDEVNNFRNAGPWQRTVGADLQGKTLGIIGLGKAGQRVARVARAFDMDIIAWSPNLDAKTAEKHGAAFCPLLELMSRSDIVSLHMVLSALTRHLVGARELSVMRSTAFLVNTSRAGLVDTSALLEMLKEKRIAGAGIDVYDVEPLPVHHELRRLTNVVATPHLGYVTEANYREFFAGAVEDILAWLAGTPVRELPHTTFSGPVASSLPDRRSAPT